MSDYISRETIKDTMLRYGFKAPDMTVTEFVEDELPAADVEPVRHGEWLRTDDDWSSLVTILCCATSSSSRRCAYTCPETWTGWKEAPHDA